MSNQELAPQASNASTGVGRATGFELANRGHLGAAGIESALERNRAFAAAGGHERAVVFPSLRLFVMTCLDPRVDPRTSSASASATPWSSATSAGESPRR
jgi:hypothetical protein